MDAGSTAAGLTAGAGVGVAIGIGIDIGIGIGTGIGAGNVMAGMAAGPAAAGPAIGLAIGPATGPAAPGRVRGAAGMMTGTGAYLTSQAAASARYCSYAVKKLANTASSLTIEVCENAGRSIGLSVIDSRATTSAASQKLFSVGGKA